MYRSKQEILKNNLLCGTTLRSWWENTESVDLILRVLDSAYRYGTLPRRRLTHIAARCVETVAYLLPPEALARLADLRSWCEGESDVDPIRTQEALRPIRNTVPRGTQTHAADAAFQAAHIAGVGFGYGVDNAYTNAILNALRETVESVAYAHGDALGARAALCDVIRDAIDVAEIAVALDVSADHDLGG